eukprot:13402332-Ditylum_brightwellii.AAC.1
MGFCDRVNCCLVDGVILGDKHPEGLQKLEEYWHISPLYMLLCILSAAALECDQNRVHRGLPA